MSNVRDPRKDEHVGLMTAIGANRWRVVGRCCEASVPVGARLYWINVFPYKQTCHACGRTIVEPQSPAWPELHSQAN